MIITATEFKTNLGKYLEIAASQDIFITKNGKNIARLTSPAVNKLAQISKLSALLILLQIGVSIWIISGRLPPAAIAESLSQ